MTDDTFCQTYSGETLNNDLGLTADEFSWCMNIRSWNDDLIKHAREIQKLKGQIEKYKGKPLEKEIHKQITIRRIAIGECLDGIKMWIAKTPEKISIQL